MIFTRYPIEDVLSDRGNRRTIRSGIHVLKTFSQLNAEERERLVYRGHRLMELSHPGLTTCIEVIEGSSEIAYVFEWVEGASIDTMISNGHHWSSEEIVEFLRQVAAAMDYAHNHTPPLIHRDIKPQNIVFDGERYVVIDFDAAREFVDDCGNVSVIGTIGYAAPEQFIGRATPKSDQYGLGTTLVHMLTRRHPSDFPLDGLHLDLSAAGLGTVEPVISKMIDPDVTARFSNMTTAAVAFLRGTELTEVELALGPVEEMNSIITYKRTATEIILDVKPRVRWFGVVSSAILTIAIIGYSFIDFESAFAFLFFVGFFFVIFIFTELKHNNRARLRITTDGWSVNDGEFRKSRPGLGTVDTGFSVFPLETRSKLLVEEDVIDCGFLPIEAKSLATALACAFDELGYPNEHRARLE